MVHEVANHSNEPLQEPEYQVWFLVEIYQVGAGAAINESTRFANVTLADSDNPRGVVYFNVGHRLPVATLTSSRLTLQVYRRASTASTLFLQYRTVVRDNISLQVFRHATQQTQCLTKKIGFWILLILFDCFLSLFFSCASFLYFLLLHITIQNQIYLLQMGNKTSFLLFVIC